MKKFVCIAILLFTFCISANSQTITTLTELKAFAQVEGFGKDTDGFRNGSVYKVTNLNNSGAGSLRQALADKSTSSGYIVFEVAGTITLASPLSVPSNTYIAGQTAFRNGGQGITLRQNASYDGALITSSGSNIVIRYIRGRRGIGVSNEYNGDIMTFTGGNNYVIDHCSMSWGTDEIFNIWGNVEYLTLQYSIISEALHDATNIEGVHSKGSLFGNGSDLTSIYRNYFVHNIDRNPLIGGGTTYPKRDFDLVNNIIYNSGSFGMQFGTSNGGFRINILKNRLKRGADQFSNRYQMAAAPQSGNLFYLEGNISDVHRPNDSYDEWAAMGCDTCGTYMQTPLPTTYQSLTPFGHPLNDAEQWEATQLADSLLPVVGASLYEDSVDVRVKLDYVNGTGTYIDDPSDVGGWPTIANMSSVPTDTDDDGIPDVFESEHSITDANAVKEVWYFTSDDHYVDNQAGYTNIEMYLMYLTGELLENAEPYEPEPEPETGKAIKARGGLIRTSEGLIRIISN